MHLEAAEPILPRGIGTSLIPRGAKRIPPFFSDSSVGMDQTP